MTLISSSHVATFDIKLIPAASVPDVSAALDGTEIVALVKGNTIAYTSIAAMASLFMGVPLGGSLDQALVKNSSTDLDTSWKTVVPLGGDAGAVLAKSSGSDLDAAWEPLKAGVSVFADAPEDQEYTLVYKAPYAFTINSLDTALESGTCTLQVLVNGVAVGNMNAIAVTAANSHVNAAVPNVVNEGDTLSIVVSSTSSAVGLSLSLSATR